MAAPSFLRCEQVGVRFAGLAALEGVTLTAGKGEILGLIGPNGAGKTTLVNVLSGYQPPTAGRVFLGDREVTSWPVHRRARAGVGRTFQAVRLFGRLTARENVEAGALGVGQSRRSARRIADEMLERVGIIEFADRRSSALPYGAERMLGIARALATAPEFLMLDEPAAGLNEDESDELLHLIMSVRDDLGCGLLVIEHDMRLIMRLCDRVHVLDHGRTIAVGTPEAVRNDPAVLEAYLGGTNTEHA